MICFIAQHRVAAALTFAIVIAGAAGYWITKAAADPPAPIDLVVDGGSDLGVGFGHLPPGEAYALDILLRAATGHITHSEIIESSGELLWDRVPEPTAPTEHAYKVAGVVGNDKHWVRIEGTLGGGSGSGPPPTFDVAVSDIDVDVDSLGVRQDSVRTPTGSEDEDEAEWLGESPSNASPGMAMSPGESWAMIRVRANVFGAGTFRLFTTDTSSFEFANSPEASSPDIVPGVDGMLLEIPVGNESESPALYERVIFVRPTATAVWGDSIELTGEIDQGQADKAIDMVGVYIGWQLNLTAHRTGGKFEEPVSVMDKRSGDPTRFFILVNDDAEEDPDSIYPDNANATAAIDEGLDDDLVKITLDQLESDFPDGTIEILLSDSSSVRLFKDDGTELTELGLDLANPSGYLAGLLSGPVDIWLEGLKKDTDFVFSFVAKDAIGATHATDEIHILIVDFSLRDVAGEEALWTRAICHRDLIQAANNELGFQLPDSIYYKLRFDGIPTSIVTEVKVTSSEEPTDFYIDELTPNESKAESENFAVIYSLLDESLEGELDPNDKLATPAERSLIKTNLGLNIVHNQVAQVTVQTEKDEQEREAAPLPPLRVSQQWPSFNLLGEAYVQRLVYESDLPVHIYPLGAENLKKQNSDDAKTGITVDWDLNGNGEYSKVAAEMAYKDKVRVNGIKYSKSDDAADNVQVTEVAANRRTTITVRCKVTHSGKSWEFTRILRIALAKKKGLGTGLPDPMTQAWFKTAYPWAGSPPSGVLAWTDYQDLNEDDREHATDAVGEGNEGTVDTDRVFYKTGANPMGVQALSINGSGNADAALKFPDMKVWGVVAYQTAPPGSMSLFDWDKEELDWSMEHEAKQLQMLKKMKEDGTSVPGKIYAAYLRSDDEDTRNEAAFVFARWVQITRMSEDMTRAAAGGANGDVSWNCLAADDASILVNFWVNYSQGIKAPASLPGTLASIKAKENAGHLAEGTHAAALTHITAIYNGLPWDEMKTIQNQRIENLQPLVGNTRFMRFDKPPSE